MIQRKQTVFLFLALVATICCLCMPVGTFVQQGMGTDSTVFNLWMEQDGNKILQCGRSSWCSCSLVLCALWPSLPSVTACCRASYALWAWRYRWCGVPPSSSSLPRLVAMVPRSMYVLLRHFPWWLLCSILWHVVASLPMKSWLEQPTG